MESQIVETSSGPIEYTRIGNGPVLLVCHGTSQDCHSMHGFEAFLEEGFSLLIPSRPGYGKTPLEVGRSNIQAAKSLIALLDALNIQTCSLIAVSGGGPTGIAMAAYFPERITHLILMAAVSRPEERIHEATYKMQMAFYGPFHALQWGMLRLVSNLSPRGMARQTLAIFSTHDPEDALQKLPPGGIESIRRFYQGHSSRMGALNDANHRVGKELLEKVSIPTLVIHSRADKSVPFSHAEWSMQHIPLATLGESGITGHFIWIGPEYRELTRQMVDFLCDRLKQKATLKYE